MIKIMIIGNLGNDPELRYTPQGTPVASFSLCSNERTRDGAKPNWFDVNIFGNNAKTAAERLRTGHAIFVEGREEVSTWTKRTGQIMVSRKINTNGFDFVSKPNRTAAEPAAVPAAPAAQETPGAAPTDDDVPF